MKENIKNDFWKRRAKHGRDSLFEKPEHLWEDACAYFEWCYKNPLLEHDLKVVGNGGNDGSSVQEVYIEHVKPFTWYGLCLFLGVTPSWFNNFRKRALAGDIMNMSKELQDDFMLTIELIEKTIYSQKFEGAAAGFFNATIIARDLGLVDRVASENMNLNSIPLTASEIKDISNELEKYV